MAYLVTQREREIAVRVSLGASRSGVVRGIIAHSLGFAAPGDLLRLAGALASARIMRSFPYGVVPTDPLTILFVFSGVTALVVAATLVPARRAAGTNVMAVRRSE